VRDPTHLGLIPICRGLPSDSVILGGDLSREDSSRTLFFSSWVGARSRTNCSFRHSIFVSSELASLEGEPEADVVAAWTAEIERRAHGAYANPEHHVAW
jgi:hypothetical protein